MSQPSEENASQEEETSMETERTTTTMTMTEADAVRTERDSRETAMETLTPGNSSDEDPIGGERWSRKTGKSSNAESPARGPGKEEEEAEADEDEESGDYEEEGEFEDDGEVSERKSQRREGGNGTIGKGRLMNIC